MAAAHRFLFPTNARDETATKHCVRLLKHFRNAYGQRYMKEISRVEAAWALRHPGQIR